MAEVLLSGKTSFKIEVPYKLIETGKDRAKPLIVYLHGYKQNLSYFERKMRSMLEVEAYHLFLQGPYPIYDDEHKRDVENWGRAWYLYDGRQEQFTKSMELSSEFIQDLIDKILSHINASKICLLGYSMGGYLAGYFALSRPNYIEDLIVVAGRIKSELFSTHSYNGLHVLALHGKKDQTVAAQPEKESCIDLQKMGAAVTFRTINEDHRLTNPYVDHVIQWLEGRSYRVEG